MARIALAAVVLAAICVADALKLPSYIKACKRNDPKLEECALRNGRDALPKFVNGDRKYRIPNLNPLTLYNFNLDSRGTSAVGIKLSFKEAKIYGLGDADVKAVKINLPAHHVEINLLFPVLNILGDYKITGRVLVLPITGEGPANITVTDVTVNFAFNYDFIKMKSGKEHLNLTTSTIQFELGHAYLHLQNLFNGDKLLGDNMNVFINENWKDVANELGPPLADTIGEVIRQIVQQITDVVPYDSMFLPD